MFNHNLIGRPVNALRVLWISPGFASDEEDDSCIPPLQLLALALKNEKQDISILTLAYPYKSSPYLWNGIQIIPGYGWNGQWFRWINWIRTVCHASRLHRERKIDVIHSFWLGPAWIIGRFLAWRWQIPHVTTLMGQDTLSTNHYIKFLHKRQTETLVTLSNVHRRYFEKAIGISDIRVIGWGLVQKEIPLTLSSSRPIDILGCGSLIPVKNWPLWIDVVGKIILKFPTLQAEIIGAGPEWMRLEQQIVTAGLQNNIRLQGKLSRVQSLQKMQQSKILLHTSNFESFGMVLLEAVSNGCRVISTPVGIAPEIGTCGSEPDELVALVLKCLEQAPEVNRQVVPIIDETAAKYRSLYHQSMDHR